MGRPGLKKEPTMIEPKRKVETQPMPALFKNVRQFRLKLSHSLRARLLLLIGAMFLLTLLFSAVSVIIFVSRAETEAWRGRQGEAARSAARSVANFVQRAEDILALTGITNLEEMAQEEAELKSVLANNQALLEIVHLDTQGNVLVGAYQDEPVLVNLFTIPQSKWFLAARSGEHYFGDVQISANNEPYLIIALPAANQGVIAARLRMNLLWESVADIRFGQNGRAYVVNQEGQLIAHTNPEVVLAHTNIESNIELLTRLQLSDQEWFGEYINLDNIPVVAATAPVPGIEWVVVTELPQSEAFTTTRSALSLLGGGMLLLGAIALWITSQLLVQQVFKPVEALRIGTKRLGQGDLQHRIGLNRPDEIGQVASAFDEMVERLDQRERQLAAGIEALRQSEERYRGIVEDQTELICRFLPNGVLTFVNQAYCRYFDRPRETLLGQAFVPLIPTEDQELLDKMFTTLNFKNPVMTHEHRVIRANGEIRWQLWTNRALFDGREQLVEFQAVGQDITERREAREALQQAKEELEIRVVQRTAELQETNQRLRIELSERQRAEQALREAENRYRTLVEQIPAVTYVANIDEIGSTLYVSPQIEAILGFTPAEWLADPDLWFKQLHPADRERVLAQSHVVGTGMLHLEYRLLTKHGRVKWISDESTKITDKNNQHLVQGVLFDITERMQIEEQIKASLDEKTLLLKEIHHRVKNNLQVISSLLYLQSDKVKDQQALDILLDSQNRVKSMALIHEKLYSANDLARVDLGDYVKNLAGQLFRSYKKSSQVQLHVEADGVYLGIDAAVPCGLILNELISNAFKHAFHPNPVGDIYIDLHLDPSRQVTLRVRDNGVGFPAEVDFQNSPSLGLQLVNTLVKQIDGAIELQRNSGTEFIITFTEA
jgi:PAS domain S-box-containing protein